ncbi:MAG: EscU/YscU/HrcU family type III secretion system export apparatus switch protein [Burkholderiaceae bacterium]
MAEETSQEDKQLEPTERRLQKAREDGQFAQSRDLTTLGLITIFLLFIFVAGPSLMTQLVVMVKEGLTFSNPDRWADQVATWFAGPVLSLAGLLGVFALLAIVVAIVAPLGLSGFRPVFVLKFRGDRLDPIKGIQRLLSLPTLVELLKTVAKAFFVLGIGLGYLWILLGGVSALVNEDFELALQSTGSFIFNGAILMLFPLVLIGFIDALFQRYNYVRQLRMSPEEVKQEMKETEGSPEVRAKIRQKQRQMATSRMMSAVERADVVVVNPDHYSVALRYDEKSMRAPIVVAKGLDATALRIQEIAKEHTVPIARIPPLARLLYARLDIGEPIPEKLFEAVAKVLAWAYELKQGTKTRDDLPEIDSLPTLQELENAAV